MVIGIESFTSNGTRRSRFILHKSLNYIWIHPPPFEHFPIAGVLSLPFELWLRSTFCTGN